MPVLLVAYDIHTKEDSAEETERAADRRAAVLKYIEQYPSHRRLSESAYAIETSSPATVGAGVWELVEPGDEFYIIPLGGPAQGREGSTLKWLTDRLGR